MELKITRNGIVIAQVLFNRSRLSLTLQVLYNKIM